MRTGAKKPIEIKSWCVTSANILPSDQPSQWSRCHLCRASPVRRLHAETESGWWTPVASLQEKTVWENLRSIKHMQLMLNVIFDLQRGQEEKWWATFDGRHVGLHLPLQPSAFRLTGSRFGQIKDRLSWHWLDLEGQKLKLFRWAFSESGAVFWSIGLSGRPGNSWRRRRVWKDIRRRNISHLLSLEVYHHLFKLLIFGLICFSQFLQNLRNKWKKV